MSKTSSETPRVSLNKLGEYLISSPSRRRTIVKQAKEPPDAIVPRYRQAFPPIEKFFETGNEEHIHKAIERLRLKQPKSDWERDDNLNTALALDVFLKDASYLREEGCIITRANPQEQSKLLISGVQVSVRPDFYVRYTKRCRDFVGAIKFHWTKDDAHKLTEQGGLYVCTTVHQFLETYHSKQAKPSLDHCISVDVFRHSICTAPRASHRLKENIKAGCEEIALRWQQV